MVFYNPRHDILHLGNGMRFPFEENEAGCVWRFKPSLGFGAVLVNDQAFLFPQELNDGGDRHFGLQAFSVKIFPHSLASEDSFEFPAEGQRLESS